jgi:hypothetical protein
MANTKSAWATGKQPMPSPVGSEVLNVLLSVEVAAGDLGAGDLIIMGELPADCVLVDAVYAFDDLDSGGAPALSLTFGTINTGETDLDTTIEASITEGQAGGAARLTPTLAALAVQGGSTGVAVGYKVATAAATGAAGTAQLSLSYRAVAHGA